MNFNPWLYAIEKRPRPVEKLKLRKARNSSEWLSTKCGIFINWFSSQQANSSLAARRAPLLIYHPTLSFAWPDPLQQKLHCQLISTPNSTRCRSQFKAAWFPKEKRTSSTLTEPPGMRVGQHCKASSFFCRLPLRAEIRLASDYFCQGLPFSLFRSYLGAVFPFSGKSRSSTIEKTKLSFFQMLIHWWKDNGTVRTTIQRGLRWWHQEVTGTDFANFFLTSNSADLSFNAKQGLPSWH